MKPDTTAGRRMLFHGWLPVLLLLILLSFIVWLVLHTPAKSEYKVVYLTGNTSVYNLSKEFNLTTYGPTAWHNSAVLAEEGDLLLNNHLFRYSGKWGDSLRFEEKTDTLILVNGSINTLVIGKQPGLSNYLSGLDKSALTNLENIRFSIPVTDSFVPLLQALAIQHPGCNILFDADDSTDLVQPYLDKAAFFHPAIISIPVFNHTSGLLSKFPDAEYVYLTLKDTLYTNAIPALPKMKTCILYADKQTRITDSFFANNTGLRNLVLITGEAHYSILRPLKNLDQLVIHAGEDSTEMESWPSGLENLSVLIFSGDCKGLKGFVNSKKIRWLGLPDNTTQADLELFRNTMPDIQVIQLNGSGSLNNYSALENWTGLRALVVTDTVKDKESLHKLKKLRYLSVPVKEKNDSLLLLELEKALPGCIVVPNSGACLGSGWLMLLFPVLLIFLFSTKKVQTHD